MNRLDFISSFWQRYYLFIVGAFCFLFALIGSLVSLHRYWQYEAFYFDFGIFDQAIWNVSRFKPPVIEHFVIGSKWIFADHFNPSIFLLSPLYWLTSRSEMLLIVQAVIVAISGFVLFSFANRILKNSFASFVILYCYFFFVGLHNAIITDFHEVTIMTLPLMLTFWMIVKKRVILYFLFLLITLGFKEIFFTLGVGIGIAIFFIQPSWKKIGVMTILLSILWGMFGMYIVIPYFLGGEYIYTPELPQTISGKILSFVDQPVKRHTIFWSFASFGFFPIFSPAFWASIVQDYVVRFMPNNVPTRWGLGLHYNAQSAVLFSLSTVYGFLFWKKRLSARMFGILLVLLLSISGFISVIVLKTPFALAFNSAFYQHSRDFGFLDSLVKKIPSSGSVMTHNNLLARFSHQKVWILRENYESDKPEYILFDMRDGQNPNNFFATRNFNRIPELLKNDPNYILMYHTDEQFIYKRK